MLDDPTFRTMAKIHPEVSTIRELRHALTKMRHISITVGKDGRNRCSLSPFASKTGRNQPSSTKSIFGPSVWIRGLIKPELGMALAYIDWEQQEFGIAAALSGDPAMMEAYTSGDPYLSFAKQAGAVPQSATKKSHPRERERFKVCALGVQYGMGAKALAVRLGECVANAKEFLRLHKQTYRKFWEWSEDMLDYATLTGRIQTVFGWSMHVGPDPNPRSLMNFRMQANGAEMLRLACCDATENGIVVCAPVHDAVLIEAPVENIESEVASMLAIMQQASEIVLRGFALRTEHRIYRHPQRYQDERGVVMWNAVMDQLSRAGEHIPFGDQPLHPIKGIYMDASGSPA